MSNIPIVINNFNRLTTTKKLCDDLSRLGYQNIHILDNLSTYPPLLEWYASCPYTVKKLTENLEGLSIYNSGYINEFPVSSWIAYTDSDIELNSLTPVGFVEQLTHYAEKYGFNKAGLALKIDDLPETNDYALGAKEWEKKYWENRLEPEVYSAEVDTTFSVIKVGIPFQYQAVRVAGNFTAKHIPWYNDFNNLDEEEQYYIDHALYWSTYKKMYVTLMTQNSTT